MSKPTPKRRPPLTWPQTRPLRLLGGGGGRSHLPFNADETIREFIVEAYQEGYLPPGLRLCLPAGFSPADGRLDLRMSAVVSGPQDEKLNALVYWMATASKWNRAHNTSYYQRVSSGYSGHLGSVAVFSCRGDVKLRRNDNVHVGHFKLAGELQRAPVVHKRVVLQTLSQRPYIARVYLDEVESPDQANPESPHTGDPSRGDAVTVRVYPATEDPSFGMLMHQIAADSHEYFEVMRPLLELGTVVIAAPRQLYAGGAKGAVTLSRAIGSSGMTYIFDAHYTVRSDDLLRCYLLAERAQALSTIARTMFRLGEADGLRRAYGMIVHSLGNARDFTVGLSRRAGQVLRMEEVVAKAAIVLAGGDLEDGYLENWVGPNGEAVGALLEEMGREKAEGLQVHTECLNGKRVDPRLLALVLEMTRNIAKQSGKGKCSVEVMLEADGIAVSARGPGCIGDLRAYATALERIKVRQDSGKGLDYVLMLLESLTDGGVTLRVTVAAGETPRIPLPCSGEQASGVVTLLEVSKALLPFWESEETAPTERTCQFEVVANGLPRTLVSP